MKRIEFFEPAMCCETGICGIEVDPVLLKINSLTKKLKEMGYEVSRYNLGQTPANFVENQIVNNLMQENGVSIFPLLMINGEVVKKGEYPNDKEIYDLFGVEIASGENETNACC